MKPGLFTTVAASLVTLAVLAAVGNGTSATDPSFHSKLDKDRQILHAFNRLAYGPQPGDIQRIKSLGLKKWMDQQLHPERLREKPELEEKLQPLETLVLDPAESIERYPTRQVLRQIADGKRPLPSDPFLRAAVENQLSENAPGETNARKSDSSGLRRCLDDKQIQVLENGSAEDKRKLLTSQPPANVDSLLIAMPKEMRAKLINVAPPDVRRKLMLLNAPQQAVTYDLWQAKIYRAIYSNRQLAEVLDDFWFNHFNVYIDKGQDRYLLAQYEREAIRPNVFGKFRDLLGATAKSPAMLFYLDNWESIGPHSKAAEKEKKKKRGLNENYGRELLELHTLGVNGGYTQKDVIEVARCFTGWTIRQPRLSGEFFFDPRMHDQGAKVVLGQRIEAGGMEDAERVLDILARQPATARHISYQIAQRFVSDNPPQSLVDRMSKTFLETNGDIRDVLKTMIDSPEFWTEGAYLAKMKTPFEMAISAARALDADVEDAFALSNRIAKLGEPLYRKQEPTGYSNISLDWMNSAALLARLNFALAFAGNKLEGVHVNTAGLDAGERDDLGEVAQAVMLRPPTRQTLDAIRRAVDDESSRTPEEQRQYLAGLVIGSPDFQRR